MADETQPEVQPDPAAPAAVPAETPAEPAPAVDPSSAPTPDPAPAPTAPAPEPAVTPDPAATPSTSAVPSAPTSGETTTAPDPSQFKKDELVTAAEVQGVEVQKGDTKADIAEKLATPVHPPVLVNLYTKRSDDDALLGSWVEAVSGPYQGRKGHYMDDVSHDPDTGYPVEVLIRTRDALNELLSVKYSDIRPSEYTGGR